MTTVSSAFGRRTSAYVIDPKCFDNLGALSKRAASAPPELTGKFRTTLGYLYLGGGPKNLPRATLRACAHLLTPAENVVVRWLQCRTNGQLRRNYGHAAALAAKRARYRCENCGFADVRALNLDHVDGRGSRSFRCLCANCHAIKSRAQDWTGRARESCPQKATPE
jgi:hypothetical protein